MPPRLAILGAGPIGLEMALAARAAGLDVCVYEKGRIAEHVQRWGHVSLFTPFGMNVTAAGRRAIQADFPHHTWPDDGQRVTGKEMVERYWMPLAKTALLRDAIHTECEVVAVARRQYLKEDLPGNPRRASAPFRLLLRHKGKETEAEADIVCDCTGTYGQHRWLGEGGAPALGESAIEGQIAYGLADILGADRDHYAGRTVVVVGAGYSAATSVCALAELAKNYPQTWIVWLARQSRTPPLPRFLNDPLPARDRLAQEANYYASRSDGPVEFYAGSQVVQVDSLGPDRGFRVIARVGHKLRTWEVDRIVANVGYTPDNRLYRELQVHECYATLGPMRLAAHLLQSANEDCLQHRSLGPDLLRSPEPNFFILGSKSFGRRSDFLLQTGFAQIAQVMQMIQEKL